MPIPTILHPVVTPTTLVATVSLDLLAGTAASTTSGFGQSVQHHTLGPSSSLVFGPSTLLNILAHLLFLGLLLLGHIRLGSLGPKLLPLFLLLHGLLITHKVMPPPLLLDF